VLHIVLDVLLRLATGVSVYCHDTFLPFEYPREWVIEQRRAWAEQYLLQAFLAYNSVFEVVLPAALSRKRPDLIWDLSPSYERRQARGSASFWIKRA
jgi:hypothetical protein